jgi:RNA polymerase sigma-70 factor (ECF subfamily)
LIFRAVEDADLIERTRKGDVESYNLLISRWEKRVYNYLLRILGSREDALDMSQEVFLKAYQNIRKLDDASRFGPWIFRIAHNEAYSLFRKRKPEDELTGIERPSERAYPIELTLAATAALDKLSAEQREAVVLKIYQGFKFEEMAEVLDCPISTVKSRLYSALEILKSQLVPLKTRGVL